MVRRTLAQRTFLLTGATGFIGSCLLRRLVAEGARPHVIIRKDARLWRIKDLLPRIHRHTVDLGDGQTLAGVVRKVRPDVVYHLAANGAYSSQNSPDRIIETNVTGTWNLLKAAAATGYELFVNTGSSSEYGFKTEPMKESDALEPASYYAVTKCAATWLCRQVAQKEHRPIVTLRLFSVYGPYEEPARLVPTLMAALREQKPMDCVQPDTARDFIHIDDVLSAYLHIDALKAHSGEVFNIGTGRQTTIRQIVGTAVRVSKRKTEFRWGAMSARSWDSSCWVANMARTKRELGWSAKVSLSEGLKRTWEWHRKNYKLYCNSGELPG